MGGDKGVIRHARTKSTQHALDQIVWRCLPLFSNESTALLLQPARIYISTNSQRKRRSCFASPLDVDHKPNRKLSIRTYLYDMAGVVWCALPGGDLRYLPEQRANLPVECSSTVFERSRAASHIFGQHNRGMQGATRRTNVPSF